MKKRKSLFVILLSALLMISMMSAMAFAKDEKDVQNEENKERNALKTEGISVQKSAPLYVGGKAVPVTTDKTKIEGAGITGEVYAQFDSDGTAATLWLDGAEISKTSTHNYYDTDYTANIHSENIDLTIVLNGDNVVGDTNSLADYAIDVTGSYNEILGKKTGDLTIQGSGTLTVKGEYDAIYSDANCKIESGKIEATSTQSDAIYAKKGIAISGGTVNATAKQAENQDAAIYANSGNLTISGDDTVVNAEVVGSTDAEVVKLCYALYSYEGSIDISGGKVNAKVSNGDESCHAIYAYGGEGEVGDIKISDAKVFAETDSGYAICGNSIDIIYTETGKHSTYVDAKVTESNSVDDMQLAAIIGYTSLKKSDNLAITTPKGGSIEEVGRVEAYTVVDGEKIATHAVIQPYKYKITVEYTTGGKAKTEPDKEAAGGEEVKVITTPDEGCEVDKIIIIDEDGKETDVTGKSAFTMGNSNVTVKVSFRKKDTPAPKPTPKAKPVAVVRGIAKGNTSLKFTWNKVKGAAKYEIWMSKCNTDTKKYHVKKIKTFGASKTTWTKKKLKRHTAYKFRVVAKDASGKVISKSLIGHAITGNVRGDFTNAKRLKVSKASYTLKKGGKAKIKAAQTRVRPGKKLLDGGHAVLLRYRSNNTSVAKVDSKGKIRAVGKGKCMIYVQTVNGIWKKVKVSVK